MLNCSLCTRQYIRTLCVRVVDNSSSLPSSTFALRRHLPSCLERSYSSPATTAQPATSHGPPMMAYYSKHKQRAIAESDLFSKRSLELELRYLKDPLKLADYTLSLLQKDGYKKAYELVKMSSKEDVACTVAWNHLIGYEMSNARVSNAVKLFNDMKKRAQKPDSYTFNILLRGLSSYANHPQTLARALSIYQSMHADNCPVKPSIIHTNALLRVCARCKDTDALFGVAAKLPTRGAGAPNNLTFTIILNALRTAAWTSLDDDTDESKAKRRYQATMQGRRIWGDVIAHWQKGDIGIDEELVCAMGRLLLLGGSENDCKGIFALVEQTMGIRCRAPRLVEPSHRAVVNASTDTEAASEHGLEPSSSMNEFSSKSDVEIPGSEFEPIAKLSSKKTPYALPSRNTLSMVLDACVRLRAIPLGQEYWNLLTNSGSPYMVIPDSENIHMYLRLLRIQRASKLALELVSGIRRGSPGLAHIVLEAKTFRVALSACVRDSLNPNVLDNAGKLVRMMVDTLEMPDVKSLEMYLHVAIHSHGRDWRSLMGVLRGSVLGVRNLRSYLSYEALASGREKKKGELKANLEDVVSLARKIIGAFDITIDTGAESMSKQERAECMEQRNIMARWVTRMNHLEERKKVYGKAWESPISHTDGSGGDDNGSPGITSTADAFNDSDTEFEPQGRMYMESARNPPRRTEGGMRKRMQRMDRWTAEKEGQW